jgi:hypothetical protein
MRHVEIHLVKRRWDHDITKSSRIRAKPKASLFLFVARVFSWASNLDAQTPFYQGKQIKLIIGSTAGGGYDLWPRMMLRYLTRHIPGNPEIIPQNMPGAGGVVAANYIYGIAKPDGLTIGAFNPALYFDQLIKRDEVKFDWAKFTWIGDSPFYPGRHPFQDRGRFTQRQGAAQMRHDRNRIDRPLYTATHGRNVGNQDQHRQRLSGRGRNRSRNRKK